MRFKDWPQRLDAEVERARGREFRYGDFDCLLWAADCVLAITGEDLAAGIRGSYSDEQGARAILKAHGSLEALVTAKLGASVHPSIAQRGDVVAAVLGHSSEDCAGVCIGHYFAFPLAAGEGLGLRFARRELMRLAWKVG